MRVTKCKDDMSHYSVMSPEMTFYEYFEGYMGAPEVSSCWVEVLAHNAAEAKSLAIKNRDFKEWVDEARSDGFNPFKGVKAELFRCEHGTCFGCTEECPQCLDKTLVLP